jgi:hypothetical protein
MEKDEGWGQVLTYYFKKGERMEEREKDGKRCTVESQEPSRVMTAAG